VLAFERRCIASMSLKRNAVVAAAAEADESGSLRQYMSSAKPWQRLQGVGPALL